MSAVEWKTAWLVVGYAPNIYQRGSLMTLMGVAKQQGDGSYYAAHCFNSLDEAKEWLYERLHFLFRIARLNAKEFREQLKNLDGGGLAISYEMAYCKVESIHYSEDKEEEEEDGD